MEELKEKLRKFAEDRNWNQFHNPKNLAMALGGEVGNYFIHLYLYLYFLVLMEMKY